MPRLSGAVGCCHVYRDGLVSGCMLGLRQRAEGKMPRPGHTIGAIAFMLLALCHATKAAELAPTIMINGFKDLEGSVKQTDLPVCQFSLRNAASFKSKGVSFALAVFPMAPDKTTVDSYAYKDTQGRFVDASPSTVARWQSGLERCFRAAVQQGFTRLHVLGHVDPVHPVLYRDTTWRNLLLFSPLKKYGGYSYDDVMIKPVIRALAAAVRTSTEVSFSISGEMGLSNFLMSQEWTRLVQNTRQALQAMRPRPKVAKVAATMNWQMVCGCVAPANLFTYDPIVYNQTYVQGWNNVKQYAMPYAPAFRALLAAGDYLGLSAYGSGYPTSGITWRDMEKAMETMAFELSFFGFDVKAFTRNKEVILVELGLGGTYGGSTPAPSLSEVVKYPFSGNWPVDGYSKDVDPWLRPGFREYRRAFHKALVEYLGRGRGRQYRVDDAYVWSVGSFDFFGVHPVSTSNAGTFADSQIVEMVRQLNGRQ